MVTCQHTYYCSIQSRRRGERGAIRLVHRCWKILHLIWMHRNAALHESEAHHNNRGATHLPSVITSEHSRGLVFLHRVYAPYFLIPLADLLNRQISYQKQWFLLKFEQPEKPLTLLSQKMLLAILPLVGGSDYYHDTSIFSPFPSIFRVVSIERQLRALPLNLSIRCS